MSYKNLVFRLVHLAPSYSDWHRRPAGRYSAPLPCYLNWKRVRFPQFFLSVIQSMNTEDYSHRICVAEHGDATVVAAAQIEEEWRKLV
jgi:hypothetical protein